MSVLPKTFSAAFSTNKFIFRRDATQTVSVSTYFGVIL